MQNTDGSESRHLLKKAVAAIPVPPALATQIRSRILQQDAQSVASNQLRRAVDSIPVDPFLGARIRNRIAHAEPRHRWIVRLAPVGVAAAVLMTAGAAWQMGHLRITTSSQNAYIASVSTHVATLMRVGLGDHIHCSVFRKYSKNAPTTESFLEKMNPQYAGLIAIVRSQIPGSYRMMLAHECRYQQRKFVHLSLMDGSHQVSLVIARKGDGESFLTENMLPALMESGIPMYQSDVQRFQMTAFETRDHLVYFISDLPKQQNTTFMLALAPQVKAFLAKAEL